jgi:hypothetical protein
MKNLKPFLGPLAIFILVAVASIALGALHYSWASLGLASCYPHCFCERFHDSGVAQPLSSYSNLFYFFAGLLIIGSRGLPAREGKNNLMIRSPEYVTGFGGAVIAIGATSMFFHVSLTTLGRWLDYMGMYAFVGFALLYGLTRLRRWKGKTFLGLYAAGLAALGGLWVAQPEIKRYLLAGLILAVFIMETAVRRNARIRSAYLYAALSIFLAAFALNVLDDGILCNPASLWQWHAVWHFLTAAAAGLVFLYYRSENESAASAVRIDGRISPGKGRTNGK